MISKLTLFLKRPTSTAVIINTVGNYLNVFFSAFFVYLLVRILNPSEYGVFSVLFGITFVLANILDFGTTATIYSYLPGLIEQKSEHAYRFIKSTFFYQTLFSSIFIAFLLLAFPWLDEVFFKTHSHISTLYITSFSVLFFIWQNFLSNCLYVAKRVLQVNLYTLYANIAKTAIVLVLMWLHMINIGIIIFVFGIIGPTVFFLFVYASKKNHMNAIMKAPVDSADFRLRYMLTYFIASQFFNLGMRMDLFLLSYFRPKDEVGYYGLAQKIILTIIATVTSITQVISPAFSRIKTQSEVRAHAKSAFMYMLVPTAIFLLLAITPNWVFDLFFTEKFQHTATISRILALVYIPFSFISVFHLFLLYTVKRPGDILIGNLAMFFVISVGCFFFIPYYGSYAAIVALGVSFIVASIVLTFFSAKAYKKLPVA